MFFFSASIHERSKFQCGKFSMYDFPPNGKKKLGGETVLAELFLAESTSNM